METAGTARESARIRLEDIVCGSSTLLKDPVVGLPLSLCGLGHEPRCVVDLPPGREPRCVVDLPLGREPRCVVDLPPGRLPIILGPRRGQNGAKMSDLGSNMEPKWVQNRSRRFGIGSGVVELAI